MTVIVQILKATLPIVIPVVVDIVVNHYLLKHQNHLVHLGGPAKKQGLPFIHKEKHNENH